MARARHQDPVIVVAGTHGDSLHSARAQQLSMVTTHPTLGSTLLRHCSISALEAELKFERIREAVAGEPFSHNIHSSMFCVNSLATDRAELR